MSKMKELLMRKLIKSTSGSMKWVGGCLLLHLAALLSLAQTGTVVVKADANSCELNSLHFDIIRAELANNPFARLLVRAYGGRAERRVVNLKRIAHVRKFLKDSKGFDSTRMKFIHKPAQGEIEPRLEFFVQRNNNRPLDPYLVVYSKQNRTPCLDCCSDRESDPKIIGP